MMHVLQHRRKAFVSAGFDPSLYGTPVQWSVADDVTGADGDPVATWPFNTYGVDLTQSDSACRPVIKRNILNGHSAVRFVGPNPPGGDFLIAALTVAQPFTAFLVGDFTAGRRMIDSTASRNIFEVDESTGFVRLHAGSNIFGTTDVRGIRVFSYTEASSNGAVWFNGTADAVGAIGSNSLGSQVEVASYLDGTTSTFDLAMWLVYNSELSTGNREGVEDALGAIYNITITH